MWKEKGSCRHPGLAAPHVSDSRRKRGGIGSCRDEQRESDERGSAGWEAALSWRQSLGSRCSWQKHEQNVSFCNKQSTVRQKSREIKHVPPSLAPSLYSQSLLLRSDEWNGRLRAIKRQSWATATPLLVSFCSGDLRSTLFPEESLWTISGMPNRRKLVGGGGVDYTASRNAPKHS